MSIRAYWFNKEKTILIQEFEGHISVSEIKQLVDETRQRIDETGHTVYIINDLSKASIFQMVMSRGSRYAEKHISPYQGFSVLIGLHPFLISFFNYLQQRFPKAVGNMYMVGSIEEAVQIIQNKGYGSKD